VANADTLSRWVEFWSSYPQEREALDVLQERLGYRFQNLALLFEAMTHRSALSDFGSFGQAESESGESAAALVWNERIEFLGDSVLGLAISGYLWVYDGSLTEGELSRRRASLVNEETLAEIARGLSLGHGIALGKGEAKSGGRERDGLLADALEALIGAVYLDAGFERTRSLVLAIFAGVLERRDSRQVTDFKTTLQELVQSLVKVTPEYRVLAESGPDHAKDFDVAVYADGRELGRGRGANKKAASQAAAKSALLAMQADSSLLLGGKR
jgi:ribonuclease-3